MKKFVCASRWCPNLAGPSLPDTRPPQAHLPFKVVLLTPGREDSLLVCGCVANGVTGMLSERGVRGERWGSDGGVMGEGQAWVG